MTNVVAEVKLMSSVSASDKKKGFEAAIARRTDLKISILKFRLGLNSAQEEMICQLMTNQSAFANSGLLIASVCVAWP
jgi:hypothetical protein